MKKYQSLIEQTFEFPTNEFNVNHNNLFFHDIDLVKIIEEYGTPLKITYLPKITQNIQFAREIFKKAFQKYNYNAKYTYCYCTKSSHFKFVVEEALKNNAQLETSSTYDIEIIKKLYSAGKIDKNILIICNGFKLERYVYQIANLINSGFENCIPILDNRNEIEYYTKNIDKPFKVGIRVAADEEPNFDFYTSRLGIRYKDVVPLCEEKIANNPKLSLKTIHFFINSGIRDSAYYWSELSKFVYKYCELKKICPELDSIDIGGGFPIKTSLDFEYDYEYMAEQIIENIQVMCEQNDVPVPNIITEFGNYTVGESGATIYKVAGTKLQNDVELWYMLNGSFITHIPDTWAKNQKFIALAINNWQNDFQQVHLGGITCDSDDYYNSEANNLNIFMPVSNGGPQYVGFFHTGAYQESIGGYGGLQHCLIPGTKHLVIDKDENGELKTTVFREEQKAEDMLKILGY
ncbi:arginine decarboxylase [Chondrinema litorale]|uniref:arginine decarboxylase n=1 Tax=Chondrinema litorale TaxID=2994555 RepID=UPI002543BFCE|nr:arginine decarboxylase [Chondrinema litorale]UZR94083.1 arginine decarboxylase [Chondrinema litorale]